VLPLIYTNVTAAGIFLAACLIWLMPETIGLAWKWLNEPQTASVVQDRGSLGVLLWLQWIGLALNFALAGLLPAAAIPWPRTALFVAGLACMLLGVGLRWYSIWTLGRYFRPVVAVSAGQPVVERGPYRLIRHPAYSGTFLTMLGLGLALTNWASLAALMLCVFAGYFYRVRVEEAALVRAIGQPYVDYMRRTKRFIPGVF
jgi:protein-S-isoprenylcysteine O-methyltransferase Ste14